MTKAAYNKVTEEMLCEKIKEVETAHINSQHGLAWKLVNDISGRRETQKGQIAGNTQQERLQNWHKHFMGLLGNPPNSDSEDNDIQSTEPSVSYLLVILYLQTWA